MKDEIKEILDINIGNDREAYIDYIDKDGKRKNYEYIEAEDLLDYITNLQEETERQSKAQVILDNQIAEMLKYKQRNEKAIELLKDIKYDLDIEPWSIYQVKGNVLFDLLNILQGKSDE